MISKTLLVLVLLTIAALLLFTTAESRLSLRSSRHFPSHKLRGLLRQYRLEMKKLNSFSDLGKHKADLDTSFADQDPQIWINGKEDNIVFGSVEETEVAFVIDVSASMKIVFHTPDGSKYYTRLDYVKEQLINVISGLQPYQRFNMYLTSNVIHHWSPSSVPATADNIQNAISYLKRFEPTIWKGTNISGALNMILNKERSKNGQLKAIYLLSSHSPNVGITNISEMKQHVIHWNRARQSPVVINTVAFSLGYYHPTQSIRSESREDKRETAMFMKSIAEVTGGKFKVFDDGTSK